MWFCNCLYFCGFILIIEQMLDHHGFSELEIVDFHWFYNDSGAIRRGHEEVEAFSGGDGSPFWIPGFRRHSKASFRGAAWPQTF